MQPGVFTSSLNPLHCGAVVASGGGIDERLVGQVVSIPFIAGQWSLPVRAHLPRTWLDVSIPFIAGQWSLRKGMEATADKDIGLNPLHCGAVVASLPPPKGGGEPFACLNPLHCGAVVASCWR